MAETEPAQRGKPGLPPNDALIRTAEQQEMRFCSLMLKDKDCLADAV